MSAESALELKRKSSVPSGIEGRAVRRDCGWRGMVSQVVRGLLASHTQNAMCVLVLLLLFSEGFCKI